MFDGFDASIYVLVLYPALSELLHTQSHAAVGSIGALVLAVFMLGWASGAIVFGALSDKLGRVRIMIASILLYAVASGLCALSHSWQELAAYRFLVGLGIGGEMGAGAIFLSESFKGQDRRRALALMTAAICAGYLLSAFANMALGHLGWRYVFLCGLAPALLAICVRSQLHDNRPVSDPSVDVGGSTAGQLIFSLHTKKTVVILILASVAIVNWWAVLSWVPAWVNQMVGGAAVVERSIVQSSMYLGAMITCLLGFPILAALKRRRSLCLAFGGSLLFDLFMFLTVKHYGVLLLAAAFGAGAFAVLPFLFLYTAVPELYPAKVRGTAFGISIQTGRTFAALAAVVGGQIISVCHGSYPAAGCCVAMVNIFGLLAAWMIPDKENYLDLESAWAADTTADLAEPSMTPSASIASRRNL